MYYLLIKIAFVMCHFNIHNQPDKAYETKFRNSLLHKPANNHKDDEIHKKNFFICY